ncbi:hypothetical protein Sjap_025437 [Stephania japonica]|uniref:Uncharacterized protein n=1 Tax=Stephania japonica TaxID=461633 RepID=A0AAP0E1U1_9MAGN
MEQADLITQTITRFGEWSGQRVNSRELIVTGGQSDARGGGDKTIQGKILHLLVVSYALVWVLFAFVATKVGHHIEISDSVETFDVLVTISTIDVSFVNVVIDLREFWIFGDFQMIFVLGFPLRFSDVLECVGDVFGMVLSPR